MRNFLSSLLLFLLLAGLVFLSFYTLMPQNETSKTLEKTGFSMERAFHHVQKIGARPHSVGTRQHSLVRNYIVSELQKMGLEVQTQKGFNLNKEGVFTTPENIIAKIPGTAPQPKSDLVLLSHYDSAVHSSFGASDDGSGVATLLEGLRVFLKNKTAHKNNIIVCITDAEEVGLNGADLFVKEHAWTKNIGLVVNFEARGSGGPSNTIIETNHGNAQLVNAFAAAKPDYPVATSLMYSVYKLLPNDTDATVFREEKDIPSFFFAFIDGHFNYHTATDIPKNLDKNSLAQQATYLMAVLPYFGNINLQSLKSSKEEVYFNFPGINLVHYPFSWIFSMLILAWLGFFVLLFFGIWKGNLTWKSLGRSFCCFFAALVPAVLVGYFGWKLLLYIYPQYVEIQQGFPKNGHQYIAAFVALSLFFFFLSYHYWGKKLPKSATVVAPLFIGLLLNTGFAFYLKGASYFIIPICFALLSFLLLLRQQTPRPFLMLLLAIPALFLFAPLIQFFPVGLGLKMVAISAFFTIFLGGLLLPVLAYFPAKNAWAFLALGVAVVYLFRADASAGFSKENPKPNSLVYLLNKDNQHATWNSYDGILDAWNKPFFTSEEKKPDRLSVFDSKYHSQFNHRANALVKPIPGVEFSVSIDSSAEDHNHFVVKILPERNLNRMELFVPKKYDFLKLSVNGKKPVPLEKGTQDYFYNQRTTSKLITDYVVDRGILRLTFDLKKGEFPPLEIFAASNNLLNNPWVKVPPRKKAMIPRPFVLNDAVITKQTLFLKKSVHAKN